MCAVLTRFSPATRAWFEAAFAAPTRPRPARGRRSAPAGTPWSSRRPARARRWPRSCGRWTGWPWPPPVAGQALPGALRQPAQGARGRRGAQPAHPAGRHPARGRTGSALPPPDITVGMRTGDTPADERRAFARTPARHPDHHARVAVPAAHLGRAGVAARHRDGDRRRGARGLRRPSAARTWRCRWSGSTRCCPGRPSGSACPRPSGRSRRWPGSSAAPRRSRWSRPRTGKTIEVRVEVPVEDMTRLDRAGRATTAARRRRAARPSIWPAVEERVLDLIDGAPVDDRVRQLAARSPSGCAPGSTSWPPREPARAADRDGMPAAGDGAVRRGDRRAPPVIARAHHGSVSREERKHIEEALKSGQLPAVVATSSAWSSASTWARSTWWCRSRRRRRVAAGLQRVGRAGHQVGAVSRGVVFPKHRGDLLSCAVVAERMARRARIEELRYPRNPLDVLAQQIVAMVAMEPWQVGDLAALVRRAAPFAELPELGADAVLDMLSGRYPSTAFAELRPAAGLGPGRRPADRAGPGAQRLAVTSGGTIPDRGLFGVFLAGAERAARVGELDEEMVYESRVGDVFLLGSTSWRIEDITPDRVLVSPAPGAAARMPFWKGDALGRPVELGRAIGAQLRELVKHGRDEAARRPAPTTGLDEWAVDNLLAYVRRAARGDPAPARRPYRGGRAVPRRAGRLAAGRPLCPRREGQRRLGAGDRPAAHRAVRRGRPGDAQRRRHRGAAARRGRPERPDAPPGADLVAFDPDEIAADRRGVGRRLGACSPPGSGSARPGRCCCPAATRAGASRCGSSASGPPSCSTWPATSPTSRSPWRRPASACRTCFDVPGLVGLMRDLAARRVRRGRGGDPEAVAVRPLAAVRVRRRVPLRGRRAAGRAPGRRAGPGLDAARRAARPGGAARAARPGRGGRDRAAAAVARRHADAARRRGRGRDAARAR